ncbi:MAG: LysR family transcriptional regulator [Eggerthellaceae bacterium]|nr:LysR family transcriptional regulator [Eggerthellaceae bacterium]
MADAAYVNISLYQMKMFLIAAECKSFTKTSQQLHTTQSAVSKSIASMENVLGFPLFVRRNKVLELTPGGELLAQEWQHVVQNIELSIDRAYLLNEEDKRSIVIGEPDSMKTDKDYAPQIERFRQAHENITLRFVERSIFELVEQLLFDELDVIFTIDYEVPVLERAQISWLPVADSPHIQIIMYKDHALATRDSLVIGDLREEGFIVPTPTGHRNQSYIDYIAGLCEPYGFKPKMEIPVANTRSMISTLLRTRRGIIFGNRFLYDGDSPDLRHVEVAGTYSRLIVAWKDSSRKFGLRDFIDAVTADYKPAKA